MLMLERVGARVTAPLAWSAEEVPGVDLDVLKAQAQAYDGVTISVALVGRAEALSMIDEARRLALTAHEARTPESMREIRAVLRRQLVTMDVMLPGVMVAGVRLDDPTVSAEERAALVDEAHIPHLLPDVASRARALQSPRPSSKNASVSAVGPTADTSSISASSTPPTGET